MKYEFASNFETISHKRGLQIFLSLVAIPFLAACPVDSTTILDSDILANFFVQNDNGEASVLVTLQTEDLSGSNDVTLVQREALFVEQDDLVIELQEEDDGEYIANLPANASGLYTFTIERLAQDELDDSIGDSIPRFVDIDDNQAYLPDTFRELVAEPVQIGPVIEISWRVDDTGQTINGFTLPAAVESFNALASCQSAGDTTLFEIAITNAPITQERGRQILQIAVNEHLTEVLNLSADLAATTACEFDVQLVRDITGTTDPALDNRSTAAGQTLLNVPVQWSAQ